MLQLRPIEGENQRSTTEWAMMAAAAKSDRRRVRGDEMALVGWMVGYWWPNWPQIAGFGSHPVHQEDPNRSKARAMPPNSIDDRLIRSN